MATPVFAVVGHGNEEPVEYEERPIVPPGYTVVLLTKPGQPYSELDARFLWEKMYKEPSLFEDPVANKEAIEAGGNQLRIYEEGTPMPAMRYYPQSHFYNPSRHSAKMLLAGIYQFPLPYPYLSSKSITDGSIGQLTETQFQELYSGDANRQIREDILRIAGSTPPLYKLLNESLFMYKIEDLLAMNGPGVYYFFNCRYVKGLKAKVDDFIGRIRADMKKEKQELNDLRPEDSKSQQYQRWLTYSFALNQASFYFDLRLQEVLQAGSMLPEEKLPYLRNLLLENSFLEGNDELRGAAVLSNSNIKNSYDSMRALQGVENGVPSSRINTRRMFAFLKRKYLGWFDEEFGSLLRRLPLVRQKSNLGQAKYTRTGGKRKRNRKTRRRRSN